MMAIRRKLAFNWSISAGDGRKVGEGQGARVSAARDRADKEGGDGIVVDFKK